MKPPLFVSIQQNPYKNELHYSMNDPLLFAHHLYEITESRNLFFSEESK